MTLEAENAEELCDLLSAVLSEWIDFLCVPTPDRFVIYADHDEYITFLAERKQNLNGLVDSLMAARFEAVEYVRDL